MEGRKTISSKWKALSYVLPEWSEVAVAERRMGPGLGCLVEAGEVAMEAVAAEEGEDQAVERCRLQERYRL